MANFFNKLNRALNGDKAQTKTEKKPPETKSYSAAPSQAPKPPKPVEQSEDNVVVPLAIDGHKRSYTYDDVPVFTPKDIDTDLTLINPGDKVLLAREPDNPYDSEAIAAYVGCEKIGYLNRGRLKNMIGDFIDRNLPVWACVTSIDDEKPEIKLFVALYRNQ